MHEPWDARSAAWMAVKTAAAMAVERAGLTAEALGDSKAGRLDLWGLNLAENSVFEMAYL